MNPILDDPREIRSRDSQDMLGYLGRFDRQLEQALKIGDQVDLPARPAGVRSVTVSGMGGSAASGDFLQAYLGRELTVPLSVNRNYGAPGFTGAQTLSLFCSYSGDTEETVSAFQAAHAAGAPIVCISSGGALARLAREHGHPWARIPGGQPPRSALGFLSFPCLAILSRLSLISRPRPGTGAMPGLGPGPDPGVRTPSAVLRQPGQAGRSSPARENPLRLWQPGPAWTWWPGAGADSSRKNGKQLACWKALPEMNHNEVVGWRHPADLLERILPVFLRDSEDHPRIRLRLDWTRRFLSRRSGTTLEYRAEGGSWLDRLLMLILLGDYASVYLGLLNGEDPGPVAAIDELKTELSGTPEAG